MKKKHRKKSSNYSLWSGFSLIISVLIFQYTESIPLFFLTIIGLIFFPILFSELSNRRREVELKKSGIEDIDHMDGIQFEHYLSVLFKQIGYSVQITKASSDYGADLVLIKGSEKIVVQAKRYLNKVGIKAIQEISAAMNHYGANNAWVVTNSFFTKHAVELAQSNGVHLIDRKELIDLILRVHPESIPNAAEVRKQVTPKKIHCPVCDSKMVKREGRNGDFYGCSKYPSCYGTRN